MFGFQLKEYGQLGIIGVHAQEPAIQTPGLGQCSIMGTYRAPELQVKQETVNVGRMQFMNNFYDYSTCKKPVPNFSQLLKNISVEGSWTAWSAFGACSTTCGTGSQSQTRGYTGNIPCSSSDTNTQSCTGKIYFNSRMSALNPTSPNKVNS